MRLYKQKKNNKGFTLIETMLAVFMLTVALDGFFTLISNSLFSARYSRNEITANYLLQEATDYIRNDRDTVAFQNINPGTDDGWNNFQKKYKDGGCFGTFSPGENGCYIEPADITSSPKACDLASTTFGTLNCPLFYYDENASGNDFYTYIDNGKPPVNFKRRVLMQVNPNRTDEVDVKVTVEWLNGNLVRSRSLVTSLLNWQK